MKILSQRPSILNGRECNKEKNQNKPNKGKLEKEFALFCAKQITEKKDRKGKNANIFEVIKKLSLFWTWIIMVY